MKEISVKWELKPEWSEMKTMEKLELKFYVWRKIEKNWEQFIGGNNFTGMIQ